MFKKLKRAATGGHVPHRKATAGLATVVMPPPGKIVLLMQQHIGAPCEAVVAKGDKVEVGTLIGKAQGAISADIHSGVSGTVKELTQVLGHNGQMMPAVVIESDGQQTIASSVVPPAVRDRESFIAAVRACGLVGLGGAGFPTAVKLSPNNPDQIDTLIINAAECEPYITADAREMMECGDTILSGITASMKYLNIPKAVIGIERNKPEEMDLMFSLTKGDPNLKVVPLPSVYPQGAEKVLIESALGREVPAGKLPSEIGVIMMNVTTVSAIGKFLATGMPLVTKRLTVDGGAIVEPKNVEVIIGTSFVDVMEFCGGTKTAPSKLISGGPMMGLALPRADFPVVKQNNALLVFTEEEAFLPEPQPCIRCGRCISACPVGLSPVEITQAYELKDLDELEILQTDICIACGTCSFVCPAKRLVSQHTTLARGFYLSKGVKK